MVTTRLGIAAICAVLITPASWAAQNKAAAPLVSTDIIRIIGSDVDARNVIAQVLADIARLRATVFLASQIRSEWLPMPMIKGVDFVRLPDAQTRGFLSGCGQYWIITALQRTQNVVKLRLELKCGATARDYTGSLQGNAWWVSLDGQGSGYSCPQPDCPCLCR
jgi:hypothetical protein